MRRRSIAFGNFICTFGNQGGLLEFRDIVLPAFLTDTFVRKYGLSYYHFFNVKLSVLEEVDGVPVLALCGHLVKNTKLVREQVFDGSSGLVRDPRSLESSPSSFFVLVLNTHRIIYFAETAFAPDFSAFAATAAQFMKRAIEAKIDNEHKSRGGGVTKKRLREEFPRPTVQVVPISEPEQVTEYLSRFAMIEQVRFRLIRPNQETDASEVIATVRQRFARLDPDQLDIVVRDKAGLDKDEVTTAVTEAGQGGNTGIVVAGQDADGTRLKGENENFAMTTELVAVPDTEDGLTTALYNKYKQFLAAGKIKVGAMGEHVVGHVRAISALL